MSGQAAACPDHSEVEPAREMIFKKPVCAPCGTITARKGFFHWRPRDTMNRSKRLAGFMSGLRCEDILEDIPGFLKFCLPDHLGCALGFFSP